MVAAADCKAMVGEDSLAFEVRWGASPAEEVEGLRGQTVRLRFVMGRAKLYSFQYQAG